MRGKTWIFAALAAVIYIGASPAMAEDPGRIEAYVTPYYNSDGPVIRIGTYSGGLASKNEKTFVSTVLSMKRRWDSLSFVELYVAAIRLYDLGYRDEATYWFYTAQYRGRLFGLLADRSRLGGIGDRGFELYHAQNAFFQLVGPDVNGYAFGNIDALVTIINRVRRAERAVGDIARIYPGVAFTDKSQWTRVNADLNSGLGKLATQLTTQKDQIKAQRAQNGTAARFSGLTSKPFPIE